MRRKSLPISAIAGTALFAALHATPALAQNAASPDSSSPPSGQAVPESGGGTYPRASAALNITVAELMRRPDAYVGRNVTVTSEVDEVFTPWTVKLDENQLLSGGIDNDMLVISARPLVTLGFDPSWMNKRVRATGTVRVLQAADFLHEYGRGMNAELIRQYEGKPALIATSLTIVDQSPSQPETTSGASGSTGSGAAGGGAGTPDNAEAGTTGQPGSARNCSPSDVHCPPSDPVWSSGASTSSSGASAADEPSVVSTDSQPIGSAPPKGATISESEYPTSPGSGSMGSGVTGAPTGPAEGPAIGIGR